MKTISNYRKNFFSLFTATLMVSSVMLTSCDKDDEIEDIDDDKYTLSGNATGAKEIPSNMSAAAATLTGTYDAGNNSLNYTINWTGLSNVATAAHFHGPATATETADPLVDITIGTNGINGNASGTVTVTDAFEVALLTGKVYYNIHTALYPGGEIRSQVASTKQ